MKRFLSLALVAILFAGPISRAAEFLKDTFTAANGTEISTHTGEIGATWTSLPDGPATYIQNNRLVGSSANNWGSELTASAVPPSAEYDITLSVYAATAGGDLFLFTRQNGLTHYQLRLMAGGILFGRRDQSGNFTELGWASYTWTAGTTYTVRLEMRDALKRIYVNEVLVLSSTLNEITGAGSIGVDISHGTAQSGFHLDSISASSVGASSISSGQYLYYRFDFTATPGNMTQLAELVLRGPTATPLGLVSYSARGDNAANNEGIDKLFDGQVGTKWLDPSTTTWVKVALATPSQLESYTLTSANDVPERDPISWTLSGSNDASAWTVIDTRSNQAWISRYLPRDFSLSPTSTVPVVTGLTAMSGVVDTPFTANIQATNNPQSYSLASGSLPPGLTLNAGTGVISGTPTGGSGSFSVTAANAAGVSPAVSFTIAINVPPPAIPVVNGLSVTIGTVGTAFTAAIQATNSPQSYALASGSLPPGLNLNTATGVISGTPTGGSGTFGVTATNAGGTSGASSFTITINPAPPPAPVISGLTANTGTVGQTFSSNIQASNNPQSYTLTSGSLPPGLTLNTGTGVIGGAPTGGNGSFTVTATNAGGTSAAASFAIIINPAPPPVPVVSGLTTTSGTVGMFFSASIQASPTPESYALASGALPPGLTLNTGTGVISGTPSGGNGNFSVTATNAGGTSAAVVFAITIGQPAEGALLGGSIIGTTPWHGMSDYDKYKAFDGDFSTIFDSEDAFIYVGRDLGVPHTINRIRFYPRTGFAWRMPGGRFRAANLSDLSDAVTLYTVPSTPPEGQWQEITLSPPVSGYRYVFFTTDANGHGNLAELEFYGSVAAVGSPVVTGLTATSGTVGTPFVATIQATNSPQSYAIASGSLPAGLSLSTSTGVISGTPTGGSGTFSVTATNPGGTSAPASFTITINPAGGGDITSNLSLRLKFDEGAGSVAADSSGNANHGTLVNNPVWVPGRIGAGALSFDGASSYVDLGAHAFTVASGTDMTVSAWVKTADLFGPIVSLRNPDGNPVLEFAIGHNGNPGTVAAGRFNPLIRFNGGGGLTEMATPVTVSDGNWHFLALVLKQSAGTPNLTAYVDGSPFTVNLNGTGLMTFDTYIGIGASPSWIVAGYLDADKQRLNGAVDEVRIYNRALSPADVAALYAFQEAPPPVISGLSASTGTVGASFTAAIQATNSPQSFALLSGTLPSGLSLNTTTGVISGTPTGGNGTFSVTATNTSGTSAAATFTITINPAPPVVSGLTTTVGTAGTAFSATIQASNNPQSYALANGALPAGLTLNSTSGIISGTPTGGGGTFSVTATNAGGTSAAVTFTIVINPALPPVPVITGLTATGGALGVSFSATIQATNSPQSFTLASGSLPPGLAMNTGTGVISGIPTGGNGSFTVTATNPGGTSAAAAFTITIGTAPDLQAPTVPTGLNSTDVTPTSFRLTWNDSWDNVGIAFYQVTRDGVELPLTTGTSLTVNDLTQGRSYAMRVRARDAAGNWSEFSDPRFVQTTDTERPTAPTNLTPSEIGAYSFKLDWTGATDNRGVVGYKVYRNGQYYDTATAASMTLLGLAANTTYQMTVTAVDEAGNESMPSEMREVTTATATPPPPGPPTLTVLGGNGQVTPAGEFNDLPFDILVLDSGATHPLTGVPVTFTVQLGGGLLALAKVGNPALSSSLTINTDQDGTVQVYYRQPGTGATDSRIQVEAGLSLLTLSSRSVGVAGDVDGNGLPDAWEKRYFPNPGVNPDADPDGDGMTTRDEMNNRRNPTERLDAFPLPAGVQLVLPTPGTMFFGVKTSDWSIVPVPAP